MITFYSFLWAVIISSIMIVLVCLLRKNTVFIVNFGVTSMFLLLVCCILRLVLPLEFPEYQIVLHDYVVYAAIMEPYADLGSPEWIRNVLLSIWFLGSLLFSVLLAYQFYKAKKYLENLTIKENLKAEKVLRKIDPSGKLTVKTSAEIAIPVLGGYLKQVIYLPAFEYSDEQLYYILFHESIHWINKDTWLKLLINVFCVIFWWNPFVYLLRKNLSQLLELKCDYTLTKNLDEQQKLHYLETLLYSLKQTKEKKNKVSESICTVEFVRETQSKETRQRFETILKKEKSVYLKFLYKFSVCILSVALLVGSYCIIWQPAYEISNSYLWEKGTTSVADESNSFLVKEKDGTYTFYYNKNVIKVSAKDVEDGLYDIYPIIDRKEESEIE